MYHLTVVLGTLLAAQIGLSFAIRTFMVPSRENMDSPPDCNEKCVGSWNQWNSWTSCHGGNCHVVTGRQTRIRDCYIRYTPPSHSRGDVHQEPIQPDWLVECRQKVSRSCVDDATCRGSWGEWNAWTSCSMSSRTNATCYKSRQRFCLDVTSKDRINSDLCNGGLHADTDFATCSQSSCRLAQNTSAPVPGQSGIMSKSAANPAASTKGGNVSNHHTMIILAVSLGSVVFAVVFILLLINLIRQSSDSRRVRQTNGRDQWKRITSTTTSSYVAASEVASSRVEFSEVRSPSTMTMTSGESSSSSTNACPFSRNDSVFIYSAADSSGTTLNAFASKPRRSRYVQDNVYWEITDQSHDAHYSEVAAILPEPNREEVPNVLYDADA